MISKRSEELISEIIREELERELRKVGV